MPDITILDKLTEAIYALFGFLLLMLIQYIWEQIKIYKLNKKNKLQNHLDTSVNIDDKLNELRILLGANRCSIFQFHNGTFFNSNYSVQYFSITNEEVDNVTVPVFDKFQKTSIYKWNGLIKDILEKNLMMYKISDKTLNNSIYAFMDTSGVRTMICCVLGSQKDPMGFLKISFMHENIEMHSLIDILNKFVKTFNYLLDN